jgi:hypothetical protein
MEEAMESGPEPEAPPDGRWSLIRDVLVFQLKLGVDALRDLVLSPVSIGAALLDLVAADRDRHLFYKVLLAGRRTEAWIDLFGAGGRVEPERPARGAERPQLDRVIERVEALIVDQYERGGVTAQAKHTIDRSLDALARKRPAPPDADAGD